MRKKIRYKIAKTLVFLPFFIFICNTCFAQRRRSGYNGRRYYEEVETKAAEEEKEEKERSYKHNRVRTYDIILDVGLGNFAYEEHSSAGISGEQSVYSGDMFSVKTSVIIAEIEGKWAIDVGGEIFGTTDRVERWWSNQKLFRINRLSVRGLSMETIIRYSFEEMGLFPFQIIAQPNLGTGLVYRFYGLKRDKEFNLLETNVKTPKQVDFSLFGLEPVLGFNFTMDDGTITGYINIGTGIYGASVERNYEGTAAVAALNKTYARSVLARIGLRGDKKRLFYHLGYYVSKIKITSKKIIPDSRINQDRIVCNFGAKF